MTDIHPYDYNAIVTEVQQYIRFLRSMGIRDLQCASENLETISSWNSLPRSTMAAISIEPDVVGHCRRCRLAEEWKTPVMGTGPETARVMFVGPFPEAADGQTGMPYSGKAGELLTNIITAMKFDRDAVYICHAVKCRPKDGRTPDRFIARACRTHLEHQITSIRPSIICVFGELAAQSLLRTDITIDRLRGRFHDYNGIPVMPTHDPELLLVNPEVKRAVWEDMKQVMKTCEDLNIY